MHAWPAKVCVFVCSRLCICMHVTPYMNWDMVLLYLWWTKNTREMMLNIKYTLEWEKNSTEIIIIYIYSILWYIYPRTACHVEWVWTMRMFVFGILYCTHECVCVMYVCANIFMVVKKKKKDNNNNNNTSEEEKTPKKASDLQIEHWFMFMVWKNISFVLFLFLAVLLFHLLLLQGLIPFINNNFVCYSSTAVLTFRLDGFCHYYIACNIFSLRK